MRIIRTIGLMLVIIILFILTISIFSPAYLSVKASCDRESFEETYGDRYYVAGQITTNGTDDPVITIYDQRASTIIHEQCHLNQYNKERLSSCDNKIALFIDEAECYTIQRIYEVLGM